MAGLDPATQIMRPTRWLVDKAILLGPRVKPADDGGWGWVVAIADAPPLPDSRSGVVDSSVPAFAGTTPVVG